MAVPQGYVKITPNTLYENVEYYIDTSVLPNEYSNTSNITDIPYLDTGESGGGNAIVILYYDGGHKTIGSETVWDTTAPYPVIDGKIDGISTLNINLRTSPDWLYVKEPAPQPSTHEMTITLDEGVESLEMNFTEPDLPMVNLRVYTYGYVDMGSYTIRVMENDTVIMQASSGGEFDETEEVTQNSIITVNISGSPWYFTIYKDGSAVTSDGMDGQNYSFTITDNTTISVYCNYD